MPDTVILKNEGNLQGRLQSFLNNRTSRLKLCYRASLHGWSSQQFHQRCDDKVNTVVLVKVGNYIFGGYTDKTWQGKNFTKLFLMHFGLSTIYSTHIQNLFEKHMNFSHKTFISFTCSIESFVLFVSMRIRIRNQNLRRHACFSIR